MRKIVLFVVAAVISVSVSMSFALDKYSVRNPAYSLDNKLVLGQEENVYFSSVKGLEDVPFIAKIDTGADSTSIDAQDIRIWTSNRKLSHLKDNVLLAAILNTSKRHTAEWLEKKHNATFVSFLLVDPYSGEKTQVERPLVKVSQIRSRSSDEPILRPQVTMPITVAGKTFDTVVNLTDRSHFAAQVLIGRTLLKGHAWVFGGYKYLQEQPAATIAGRKETVSINGVDINAQVSFKYNFSRLYADSIRVDKKHETATFEIEGDNNLRKTLTLPIARMLKVSGEMKPLVYLPVNLDKTTKQYWLVYLTDSPKDRSSLRIGNDTISRYLMIAPDKEYMFSNGLASYRQWHKTNDELAISPSEEVVLDGVKVKTTISSRIITPILRVGSMSFSGSGKGEKVSYTISNASGEKVTKTKLVMRWLTIGKHRHPMVDGTVTILGKEQNLAFSLRELDGNKQQAYLTIGRELNKTPLLVNPRVDHLLTEHSVVRAGHIEKVQVAGMTFSAKLDTGADVSSISAENIRVYKENGQQMVSFLYQDKQGNKKQFSLPVVDMMKVKAKKGEQSAPRPVVEMTVKLGSLEETIRVNLQNRSRFDYSMILGQNFLKYGVLVGSDQNYQLGK